MQAVRLLLVWQQQLPFGVLEAILQTFRVESSSWTSAVQTRLSPHFITPRAMRIVTMLAVTSCRVILDTSLIIIATPRMHARVRALSLRVCAGQHPAALNPFLDELFRDQVGVCVCVCVPTAM